MTVKRINDEEFNDRLDYLMHTAGFELGLEIEWADKCEGNQAKVIEVLYQISKAARECALYLGREQ